MRRNGLHADLMEKLRVDDELHRSIRVEDRAGTAATVPLEEAPILDTAEQRRKPILSVLTEDPVQYYDLLQQARMNDDSEVVHYAATAMARSPSRRTLPCSRTPAALPTTRTTGRCWRLTPTRWNAR